MVETANVPGPLPVPGHAAGIETNASVNVLSRMPGICGKNSLCFCGKNILEFLTEYQCAAEHANLTNEKKCQELRIYFTKKEKCVLDVLEGVDVSLYFIGGEEDLLTQGYAAFLYNKEKNYQAFTFRYLLMKV